MTAALFCKTTALVWYIWAFRSMGNTACKIRRSADADISSNYISSWLPLQADFSHFLFMVCKVHSRTTLQLRLLWFDQEDDNHRIVLNFPRWRGFEATQATVSSLKKSNLTILKKNPARTHWTQYKGNANQSFKTLLHASQAFNIPIAQSQEPSPESQFCLPPALKTTSSSS